MIYPLANMSQEAAIAASQTSLASTDLSRDRALQEEHLTWTLPRHSLFDHTLQVLPCQENHLLALALVAWIRTDAHLPHPSILEITSLILLTQVDLPLVAELEHPAVESRSILLPFPVTYARRSSPVPTT